MRSCIRLEKQYLLRRREFCCCN